MPQSMNIISCTTFSPDARQSPSSPMTMPKVDESSKMIHGHTLNNPLVSYPTTSRLKSLNEQVTKPGIEAKVNPKAEDGDEDVMIMKEATIGGINQEGSVVQQIITRSMVNKKVTVKEKGKPKAPHIPKRKTSKQPKKSSEADFDEDILIKKLMLSGMAKKKRPNIPLSLRNSQLLA
ncbi:hypothetical protein GOBAR_DD06092 [Gossypium barbadense]|nr:hypothetical protein GOBAR_DD06092 [Gossypium barbadense]